MELQINYLWRKLKECIVQDYILAPLANFKIDVHDVHLTSVKYCQLWMEAIITVYVMLVLHMTDFRQQRDISFF